MNPLNLFQRSDARSAQPLVPAQGNVERQEENVAGVLIVGRHVENQRTRTQPPRSNRELTLRANTQRTNDRNVAMEASSTALPRLSKQDISRRELLENFDQVHQYDHLHTDLLPYARRDAEALRIWLQKVSQPAPAIVSESLREWALPHLLIVVTEENRRREAEFAHSNGIADSPTAAFEEQVDSYGLHRTENVLRALIASRPPHRDSLEARLDQRMHDRDALNDRLTAAQTAPRLPLPSGITNWMNRRLIRNHLVPLRQEVALADHEIRQLTRELRSKRREERRRGAEISNHDRAMHRSFRATLHEGLDRLSELPTGELSRRSR